MMGCCFPSETLIKLGKDVNAFISDVKVGLEVLAHNNDRYKVIGAFKRLYTGSFYSLSIKGIEHLLRLTEEQPVGVVSSLKHQEIVWKAACYVKLGELVLRPYGEEENLDPGKEYHRHKYGTLHPVEAIVIEEVEHKPVHRLEVDSVHTYIANDCAVHS